MSDRDFAAEMRTVIDAETADGSYVAPLVAQRIVEKLRVTDPDLLSGWLDANAVQFVREAIGRRDRSARSYARKTSRRGAFGDAAEQFDAGDSSAIHGWLTTSFVVSDDEERKPLRLMTASDLDYVAREYDSDARAARFESAFMRALKKKVGKDTVGDHFTEEQIADLRSSIGGKAA